MKEWYKNRQKEYYFNEAKKNNLISRAYYKIEEIDKKQRILGNNQRVLDLGCSPGGWIQYITKKYPNSKILGIDLLDLKIEKNKNTNFLKEDLNNYDDVCKYLEDQKLIFDNIISDIAPNTSGIQSVDQSKSYQLCELCFAFVDKYLNKNGNFLIKNFQGEDTPLLFSEIKKKFNKTMYIKPKASEKVSKEIYILALSKK